MHNIELQQNLCNGLWYIWDSSFMALRKVRYVIVPYSQKSEWPSEAMQKPLISNLLKIWINMYMIHKKGSLLTLCKLGFLIVNMVENQNSRLTLCTTTIQNFAKVWLEVYDAHDRSQFWQYVKLSLFNLSMWPKLKWPTNVVRASLISNFIKI
jgi:hypothetical protein